MFSGLDDIDWARFDEEREYGRLAVEVPQLIRNLLSDDEDTRWWALQDLFGEGQHHGTHCPETPYIIPFLLEILALPQHPAREGIYHGFAALGKNLIHATTIPGMRLAVQIFDELRKGLSLYLRAISDDETTIRRECIRFSRYMQDDTQTILHALLDQYRREPEPVIRATVLESLGGMMTDKSIYADPFAPCVTLFKQVLFNTPYHSLFERIAAASILVRFGPNSIDYTDEVHQAIGQLIQEGQQPDVVTYHTNLEIDFGDLVEVYNQNANIRQS